MREEIISISPVTVMQSAAGFYLGRSCVCEVYETDGSVAYQYPCPYDRLSGYFATAEEAEVKINEFR